MKPAEVEQLLAELIERREKGETIDAEAFLQEHPEGGAALREAIADLASADELLPGHDEFYPERIGDWRVVGPLSRGGMGRVLRVVHAEHGGPERALKLLGDEGFANPRAHERLKREGAALQGLDVRGIVRCHEVGFAGDMPFLVMDLVHGRSLGELVRRAREREHPGPRCEGLELAGPGTPFVRVARLVARLARSVAALHEAGLLHRDVKPANVVLDGETGEPVLLDLGLVGGEPLATLTASGDVLGTPAYMAPEQARGERVGPRGDVFGIGAVLWELLTLEPPRRAQGSRSVLEEIRTRPVPSLRTIDPSVPPSLAGIVTKALAWHPRWRYGAAAEMADDLDAFAAGRTPHASGKPLPQRAAELWQFRRGWLVAATVSLVLAAGIYVASRRGPTADRVAAAVASCLDAFVDGDDAATVRRAAELRELAPRHAVATVLGNPVDRSALSAYESAMLTGMRQLRGGEHAQAIASFEEAVRIAPSSGAAVLLLGLAAVEKGERDRARRELASAVRLLPASRSAHALLGRTLRHLGVLDESERVIRRGFAIGAPTPLLLNERARLHNRRARYADGLADIEQALELAGADPPRDLLNTKGVLLDQLGRHGEARAVYADLVSRFPEYVAGLFNQAYAVDRECRADEARRLYEDVLRIDAGYVKAMANLAWLHSGAQLECEKCRAAFEASPELLDLTKAEGYIQRAVRTSAGADRRVLSTAVHVAKRLSGPARGRLRKTVEELRDRPGISERRLGRLVRVLQMLPK